MATFYVPDTSYKCYVFINSTTLRAYEQVPRQNTTISYTDYYYTSHYTFTNGTQQFSTYSTIPVCNGGTFTDNVFYRYDFDSIMVIFFLILLICFYFPYRLISRAFGRWLKW